MSFYCDECGYKNNEIQTGEIQEKGVLIKSRYTNKKVLLNYLGNSHIVRGFEQRFG